MIVLLVLLHHQKDSVHRRSPVCLSSFSWMWIEKIIWPWNWLHLFMITYFSWALNSVRQSCYTSPTLVTLPHSLMMDSYSQTFNMSSVFIDALVSFFFLTSNKTKRSHQRELHLSNPPAKPISLNELLILLNKAHSLCLCPGFHLLLHLSLSFPLKLFLSTYRKACYFLPTLKKLLFHPLFAYS